MLSLGRAMTWDNGEALVFDIPNPMAREVPSVDRAIMMTVTMEPVLMVAEVTTIVPMIVMPSPVALVMTVMMMIKVWIAQVNMDLDAAGLCRSREPHAGQSDNTH